MLSILALAAVALAVPDDAFAYTKCKNNTTGYVYCRTSCLSGETNLFQSCPLPYTSGTTSSTSTSGTWNSTISCTEISGNAAVDPTTVAQSATVNCTITPDSGSPVSGICQLDISYFRQAGLTVSGAAQCVPSADNTTSTLTDLAFCGNASSGLVVSGTLNCNPDNLPTPPAICNGNNPCIANLDGITSVPNGQCGTVFPLTAELAAGQVLKASLTTTGSTCSGEVTALSNILTRFCNSGSFDPAVPSSCVFGTGSNKQIATITRDADAFLPVTVEVSPQTVNVACGGNKDQGSVTATILGDDVVAVTQINQGSLRLEGVAPSICSPIADVNGDGDLDLTCTFPSCPTLGPALLAERNPDGTVAVTLTGSLNSTTPIGGEDIVNTSPK